MKTQRHVRYWCRWRLEPIARLPTRRSRHCAASLDVDQRRELESAAGVDTNTAELVARVLEPAMIARRPAADDLDGWLKFLADGTEPPADAEAGERIFFHRKSAGCSNCHQMLGRGAKVGPELTATTGTLARAPD